MNDKPVEERGLDVDPWELPDAPAGGESESPHVLGPTRAGMVDAASPHGAAAGFAMTSAMLAQAKWWIIGLFTLVLATVVPCIWVFVHPTYQASAVVRVSPVVSRIVFDTEENGMLPLYSSYLNTQVSIIRSLAVLERVLDRPDVRKTEWFQEKPPIELGMPLSPLERLQKALTVRPRQRTELIDVKVTARYPKDVKILADAIVDEYERYSDETYREQDAKRSETLRNEKTALHNQILSLMDTKLRIASQLGTASAADLQTQLRASLGEVEMELAARQRDFDMVEWELQQFPDHDQAGQGDATEDQAQDDTDADEKHPYGADPAVDKRSRYARDSDWRHRSLQVETANHKLALARQKYGEGHPRIAECLADVDYAERLLQAREVQLDDLPLNVAVRVPTSTVGAVQPVEPAVVDRETVALQRDRLAREIELLDGAIEQQRRKLSEVGDLARDIATYDEEIRHKSELRNRLRDRLTQLDLESRAPARISIATHAIQPTRPHRDRRALFTVLALGAALCAGLGMAYLRMFMDTRIREVSEVRRALSIPFLGQLPPISSADDVLSECDNLIMNERVRMVRTALLERLGGSGHHVVLVTSSLSQTGKTTFSFLLSRSLALLGKKTLLVEADLRRPCLFDRLKVGSSTGLGAVLAGSADDRSAIVSTGINNLDLITAGDGPTDFDPEVLANGVFSTCLKRWKKKYDFVILDSPPVLPVADARILAGYADGTIMVLRSAHCRRAEVAQAYSDLHAAGGELLGTVLVGVPGRGRSKEYYGYDSYYGNTRALEAKAKGKETVGSGA